MSFFNSAVKLAEDAWVFYRQPAEAAPLFKALPSKRDVIAELTQARDAYQLVVGQEVMGVGFYEELTAQAKDKGIGEVRPESAGVERKPLNLAGNVYSFLRPPSISSPWGEFHKQKA